MRFDLAAPIVCTLLLAACSAPNDSQSSACVENLSTDCAPLYDPPTYTTIFDQILQPTCATGNGTCHTSDASQGGLVFEDPDAAYALLLGTGGGKARVIPQDPACSLLVQRLESTESSSRMPPGPDPLLAGERCAIVKWIAEGAAR